MLFALILSVTMPLHQLPSTIPLLPVATQTERFIVDYNLTLADCMQQLSSLQQHDADTGYDLPYAYFCTPTTDPILDSLLDVVNIPAKQNQYLPIVFPTTYP